MRTNTHKNSNKTSQHFPVRKNAITVLIKRTRIATVIDACPINSEGRENSQSFSAYCLQKRFQKGLSVTALSHLRHEQLTKAKHVITKIRQKGASQYPNLYNALSLLASKDRLVTHNSTPSQLYYTSVLKNTDNF